MESTVVLTRGATSITINAPQYGAVTRIAMALQITRRGDGKIGIFDEGKQYDTRYADLNFMLPESQQKNLQNLLSTNARGAQFQFLARSRMNPFGPDLAGGERRFLVWAEDFTLGNAIAGPWRNFPTNLTLAMSSAPPCSLPVKRDQGGNLSIAGISGFRQPEEWPASETTYAVDTVIGHGGSGAAEDGTSGSDSWFTTIDATCNESMAARLVHNLTQITRGKTFAIIGARAAYIFGADNNADGAGTYLVKLASPEIRITQHALDRYTLSFAVCLKDYGTSTSESSVSGSSRSESLSSDSDSSSSDSVFGSPSHS